MDIDVQFDVREDSNGLDPDRFSKKLKSYHKLLWSNRNLPNGKKIILSDKKYIQNYSYYLMYENLQEGQTFFLSSDIIATTYINWNYHDNIMKIIDNIPKENLQEFEYYAHTIGAFLLFPQNKIEGKNSINQERGTNKKIMDRFDLTLECIRLFYENNNNETPLKDVLNRYKNYFDLFVDFKRFCDFFYLNDIISDDTKKIKFFLPFKSFNQEPLPQNKNEYLDFMENCITFIKLRNNRIKNA